MASPQFESPLAALAAEIWTGAFEEMCQRMSPCFVQVQTRQRAQAYVRGLTLTRFHGGSECGNSLHL